MTTIFVIERRPMAERFWSKVDRSSEGGCWLWTASAQSGGYGQIRVGRGPKLAHRVAWELARGPIPEGLTVDHLCFRPLCVNPAHLRLLTNVENAGNQRKVTAPTCRRGHPWTPESTSYRRGVRACRLCARESARKNYRRRKDALIPGRPASPTPGSRKAGAPAPAAPVAVPLRAAAVRPRHERQGHPNLSRSPGVERDAYVGEVGAVSGHRRPSGEDPVSPTTTSTRRPWVTELP